MGSISFKNSKSLVVAAVLSNPIELLRIFVEQLDFLIFGSKKWEDCLVKECAIERLEDSPAKQV
jgi:hypothetical protein